MTNRIRYHTIDNSPGFWAIFVLFLILSAIGLGAAFYMEHHGHWVTGMSQNVVWGTPHVFAVFLIVAASGALNTASIGSVFGRKPYKPLAPLSALLAGALLIGGLAVLVLDLGRPDRLVIAMTHYNFRSIFAWNIFLYTGFLVVLLAYIWTMLDRNVKAYSTPVGFIGFLWRLVLTTGTGSIFGFLVGRAAYDAAIMAPMFIAMSFSFGTALYILCMLAIMVGNGRPVGDELVARMAKLLGVFVAGSLFFVAVHHLTNIYGPETRGLEAFLLLDGGIYTSLFWLGFVLLGSVVPMVLFFHPATNRSFSMVSLGAVLVVLGGLAEIYVIIIGGQAVPQVLFPGYEVSSSFFDGSVAYYAPSWPEVLLGISGFAMAFLVVALGVKVLRFMPHSLADPLVDAHFKGKADKARGGDAAQAQTA